MKMLQKENLLILIIAFCCIVATSSKNIDADNTNDDTDNTDNDNNSDALNDMMIDNNKKKSSSIMNENGNHYQHRNHNVVVRMMKNNGNADEQQESDGDYDNRNSNNNRIINDDDDDNDNDDGDDDDDDSSKSNNNDESTLSSEDQIKLMSKQMSALMNRRREDYKLLETNLKKYVKNNAAKFVDEDIRNELERLRQEVKVLREGASLNKEHLTIQWLSESITELRNEMTELQESTANITRVVQLQQYQESPAMEEINELKDTMTKMQLQLKALRTRQDKSEATLKQLRDEAIQQTVDLKKWMVQHKGEMELPKTYDYIEPEGDHRLRHHRILREQVHELDVVQQHMRRELSELQHHRLNDRFHAIEVEQRRAAAANFNVSRQVASLEKLHISMLELLEDVADIQTKVDKSIPDLKHEISKMEFNGAQQTSELNLIREEGRNSAKSIQAIAVSLSQLQQQQADGGSRFKVFEQQVDKLQHEIEKIRLASAVHKDIAHSRINKIEADSKLNSTFVRQQTPSELQSASQLVEELEQVEDVYESIVNKLPHDCSQVDSSSSSSSKGSSGLYLIAPSGHHPVMVECAKNWTTIQRRVDGSVDFNRSWNDYAKGFGQPAGEYWIGNEVLHQLTQTLCMRLRINIQDIYDNYWYAEYGSFQIASREHGYRLDIGNYVGNASDAMDYQNHMEFSAIDVDRDISNTHCAGNYEGGWWFSHCQHANLNGRYNLGLTWFDSTRNEWIAVKSSHMAVTTAEECVKYTPPPSNRPTVTRQQQTMSTIQPSTTSSISRDV